MAHFAELDENNIVQQVIVVNNNELLVDGVELETKGIEFCQSLFGGNWVQTSYNGTIRKNYAGIGDTYDPVKDAFIAPKPAHLPSWILDEETCLWVAPIFKPSDGKHYVWNEEQLKWIEVEIELDSE
jgi:hypothetical protein